MNLFNALWNHVNYVAVLTNSLQGCALLIASLTLYGDWQVIQAHWKRSYHDEADVISSSKTVFFNNTQYQFPLHDFPQYWIWTMISAYVIYFAGGLFYHYFYYILQRDKPEKWKCQPQTWLSEKLERDEITVGTKALFVANTWSALLACYVSNKGYYLSTYSKWNEYSPLWLVLQIPLLFLYEEYATYWIHRILHWPFMYRRFHSMHHRYRQPTAFSVVAFHPVEVTLMMMVQTMPLFNQFLPIYWPVFQGIVLYMYIMGIMNHSGVDIKAAWWQPWQPDTMFHDNHHQYFHVNFGFNCTWWDKLHKTMRKPECIYREDIYGGRGKPANEASREELEEDLRERETESPTAYTEGYNPYLNSNVRDRLKMKMEDSSLTYSG